MANDVKWVKLTTDMFDNRKIKHLRRLPDGNNIVLIWVMLLTMAGRCNSNGMIFLTENIPYTPKMLADELDFEENTVILALQALENLDMIMTDGKFFSIAGWEEYQNADKLAEIRAKDRERKRLKRAQERGELPPSAEVSKDVHGQSTDSPHIEEEEETDKEKEFHSFIPATQGSPVDKDGAKLRFIGGTLGKGVVMLSEDQMDDLLDKLSVEEFDKYVAIVAECELNGQRFKKKTHYQAILDMAMKDRKVKGG